MLYLEEKQIILETKSEPMRTLTWQWMNNHQFEELLFGPYDVSKSWQKQRIPGSRIHLVQ